MAFTEPVVSQATSPQDIQSCYHVRIKVFVHEQNIPLELEIDEYVMLQVIVGSPMIRAFQV
jgi:predicted GNAT family N-acyltransferase